MISQICGNVVEINHVENSLDIKTAGGVVYTIFVVGNFIMPKEQENICIRTELIVREDRWILFGFNDKTQQEWFRKLRSISGIGPKTALAILGTFSMDKLLDILQSNDATTLSKVKGLGLKGAKKIILDLQGVIAQSTENKDRKLISELREALRSLGFATDVVNKLVDKAEKIIDDEKSISIEDLVERVLRER